jgi:hypothetical protein
MTGEGNESAEHEHGKKEEQSSRDEEAVTKMEDITPVEIPNPKGKGKRGKGGSKSDSSEPADDDSEKNIDDDVPLSFPQRVSYCMSGCKVLCFDAMAFGMTLHEGFSLSTYTQEHEYRTLFVESCV